MNSSIEKLRESGIPHAQAEALFAKALTMSPTDGAQFLATSGVQYMDAFRDLMAHPREAPKGGIVGVLPQRAVIVIGVLMVFCVPGALQQAKLGRLGAVIGFVSVVLGILLLLDVYRHSRKK